MHRILHLRGVFTSLSNIRPLTYSGADCREFDANIPISRFTVFTFLVKLFPSTTPLSRGLNLTERAVPKRLTCSSVAPGNPVCLSTNQANLLRIWPLLWSRIKLTIRRASTVSEQYSIPSISFIFDSSPKTCNIWLSLVPIGMDASDSSDRRNQWLRKHQKIFKPLAYELGFVQKAVNFPNSFSYIRWWTIK